jgi:O-antigen/teichoic acid export membrane protein
MAAPDRRSTFVGALWNVAAMVFPLVSTLLLSVAIARWLGPEALGQQSVIAYMGSLVTSLVIMAATTCTTQVLAAAYGGDDPGRFAALARLSRRVHLAGGVLAAAVLSGIGAGRDLTLAWVLIGLVTFIDALGWSHGSRLVALDGWRAVSPLRLVSQFGATLLGVGAVLLGLGLPGVFGAQVLTSTWLTLVLRRRDRRLRPDLDARPAPLQVRPLVRLWSLFVVGMLLTQVVNRRVELLFLDAFSSSHAVAVYAVAFTVVSAAVTVPTALGQAAMPAMSAAGAAGGEESLREDLRRAARLAMLGGFLFAAALIAIGPSLVVTLWGAQLRSAAGILPWLALPTLGVPLAGLLEIYWTAMNRLAAMLVLGAISAVVDLGAAAVLVPLHGLAGAVIANVGAQFVYLGAVVVYTHRRLAGVLPPAGFLARSAAVAVVVGGSGWAAAAVLSGAAPGWALLGALLAFALALAVVSRTVGLLDRPDLDWLAGLLPSAVRPLLALLGGTRTRRAAAMPPQEPALS